jgi:hypothetical protein
MVLRFTTVAVSLAETEYYSLAGVRLIPKNRQGDDKMSDLIMR